MSDNKLKIEVERTGKLKKVLLIDDDEDQLYLMQTVFEGADFEVTVCNPFEFTEDRLMQDKPDCVVADVMMPAGGGFRILKEIRSISHSLPVLMVSSGRMDLKNELLEHGASGVCLKYDHSNSLLSEVEKLI